MESSAVGIVEAESVFPKYETEASRSTYLNPATMEIIINTIRSSMEKKLFLGSSRNEIEISPFGWLAEDKPINTPTKAKANKKITPPVE